MDTRTLDEEFLALLCEDDDLVRAEFDAIVEANWGGPPPPSAPRQPVPPTPHRHRVHPHGTGRVPFSGRPRQRSPPAREGR
ncbi:hypothetical protein [Lentzea sp. NPDC003310]|uniref:hypothetical protein n=1 Tax=Lentzea sp. NPDC003310 TaxID=3154447 RepID=UPI0033BBCDBA